MTRLDCAHVCRRPGGLICLDEGAQISTRKFEQLFLFAAQPMGSRSQTRLSGRDSSGPQPGWASEPTPLRPVLSAWCRASLKEALLTRNAPLRTHTGQVALLVKTLPVRAGDTRPRFNPWIGKIPLEKETATHSSILAWRCPQTEQPGPCGREESDTTEQLDHTVRTHGHTHQKQSKPHPACG